MLNNDKNIFIRIVDFGLITINEFTGQTHASKSSKKRPITLHMKYLIVKNMTQKQVFIASE
jgi:hypothetical protein